MGCSASSEQPQEPFSPPVMSTTATENNEESGAPSVLRQKGDLVPSVLRNLSEIHNFQEWLKYLRQITHDDKAQTRALKQVQEFALARFLYDQAVVPKEEGEEEEEEGSNVQTNEEIVATLEGIVINMENVCAWEGLSVKWLLDVFLEHPYLRKLRAFGCEAWFVRKWCIIEILRRSHLIVEKKLTSGSFVHHLDLFQESRLRLESHRGCDDKDSASLEEPEETALQKKGKPTIFISYTGAYTMEHIVQSLYLLDSAEVIWMDMFCVDQFAWTGKSRSPEMKEVRHCFIDDLERQIGTIKRTALILDKWDNIMLVLRKIWVLWEIFSTAQADAEFNMLLLPDQASDFVKTCLESGEMFDIIPMSLAPIDVRKAVAWEEADRLELIPRMKEIGFKKINQCVVNLLRNYEIQKTEERILQQRQEPSGPSPMLLNNLGNLFQDQGTYVQAQSMLKEAIELYSESLGKQSPAMLTSLNNLALQLNSQGCLNEAERLHRQALVFRQHLLGMQHPDTLALMDNLAALLNSQGKFDDAAHLYAQSLHVRMHVLGRQHPATLASSNDLALVLESLGSYAEAESMHRETLKLYQNVLGEQHPTTLTSMNNLALVLETQGKLEEALGFHQQTLKHRQHVLGVQHPETLTSMNKVAVVLDAQGKFAEAEALLRQTVKYQEEVLGSQHPDTLCSLNSLGSVLSNQGKLEEAEHLYKTTLETWQLLGNFHPSKLTSFSKLAEVLERQWKMNEAEQFQYMRWKMCQKECGNEHPATVTSMNDLAVVLGKQGKFEQAEQLLRKTVELHQQTLGNQHPDTLISMNNLACVLSKENKLKEAEDLLQKTVKLHQQASSNQHPDTLPSTRQLALLFDDKDLGEGAKGVNQQFHFKVIQHENNRVYSQSTQQEGQMAAKATIHDDLSVFSKENVLHMTIEGHRDSVMCIAYSPDGRFLASGSMDSTIHIQEMLMNREGRLNEAILCTGHTHGVNCVAWAPALQNTKYVLCLASGSQDGSIKVWEINSSGKCVTSVEGHNCPIQSLSWSHDGHWLASSAQDGSVRVWNTKTWTCVTMGGYSSQLQSQSRSFRFRLKGFFGLQKSAMALRAQPIVSTTYEVFISYTEETQRSLARKLYNAIQQQVGLPTYLDIRENPSARELAIKNAQVGIFLLNMDFMTEEKVSEDLRIFLARRQNDGSCTRNEPLLLPIYFGFPCKTAEPDADSIFCKWANTGHLMGASEQLNKVSGIHVNEDHDSTTIEDVLKVLSKLYVVDGNTTALTIPAYILKPQYRIQWSFDGKHLAWALDYGRIAIYTQDWQHLRTLSILGSDSRNSVTCVDWMSNQHLASGSSDGIVRLWQAEEVQCTAELKGHSDAVTSIKFLHSKKMLLSAGKDGRMIVWIITDPPRHLYTVCTDLESIWEVDWSPDEKWLASASDDGIVRVWDVQALRKSIKAQQLQKSTPTYQQRVVGTHDASTLTCMHNLASVLVKQKQFQEAESFLQQALMNSPHVMGMKHTDTLAMMTNLANVLESQGKYREAEKVLRQQLELSEQVLGHQHYNTITTRHKLSLALKIQGQIQEAESLLPTPLVHSSSRSSLESVLEIQEILGGAEIDKC